MGNAFRPGAKRVAVLRPEPGNAATVRRAKALGFTVIALPLFEIRPLAWQPVDSARFDGLLMTSANTLRHGGAALGLLRHLPVLAVGAATAVAATDAGFDVVATGDRDATAILDAARESGFKRLLHLSGVDRTIVETDTIAAVVAVYAAEPLPIPAHALEPLRGGVALLHSARAAVRLGELLAHAQINRADVAVAALSEVVLAAAGAGWAAHAVASAPRDDALLAAVRGLID